MSSPSKRREMDVMKLMMSEYRVEMINDGLSEFNVEFHGPKQSVGVVADINIGYKEIDNTQVLAFNGKPVKNLKSSANMVESCNDEYLQFNLDYDQVVVLRIKTTKTATLDIISTHCILSAMSDDLKS